MKAIGAALTVVALAAMVPVPRAARADGLEFLDNRPVLIDLDRQRPGARWQVSVLDGRPGGDRAVALHLAVQPAGVLSAPVSARTVSGGGVARFVLRLDAAREASGEIVVVSGGRVIRRPITVTAHPPRATVQVSTLQFTGVRLAPFTGLVRTDRVSVPDAPGRARPGEPSGHRIGVLTSARGDTAEVTRAGDEFSVRGVRRVGAYSGKLDLLPEQPGGELDATLRVRDLPVWPLLVLLLGLTAVHLLDRYQNRLRPRRLLDLRLARLRDRARAAERRTGLSYRVCALPGEPGLLLDKRVADALAAVEAPESDAEWAQWEPGGAEHQRLTGLVDSFEALADSHAGLREERDRAENSPGKDPERMRRALDSSPVGEALRGRALHSAADLADASARVEAAKLYLREFTRLYDRLLLLSARGDTGIGAAAAQILGKLLAGTADLPSLTAETDELQRQWRPRTVPSGSGASGRPVPGGHPGIRPEPTVPVPPAWRRRGLPARRLRGLLLGAAAALLICAAAGVLTVWRADVGRPPDPGPTASATPTPTGPATPVVPPPLAPPEAPVAASPAPLPAGPPGPADPSGTAFLWYGVILPPTLAGLAGAALWWVLRRRRSPAPRRLADLDTASIDRELRRENRRFALVSGVLVVLSGMSVLYAGNPTFGSAGDYLAVALWGTALGEGLHLARRLWPGGLTRSA